MCVFVLCSISCNINAKLFTLLLIYSVFANLQYIQFSSKDSIPYFCSLSLPIVYLSNHYISITILLLLRFESLCKENCASQFCQHCDSDVLL